MGSYLEGLIEIQDRLGLLRRFGGDDYENAGRLRLIWVRYQFEVET